MITQTASLSVFLSASMYASRKTRNAADVFVIIFLIFLSSTAESFAMIFLYYLLYGCFSLCLPAALLVHVDIAARWLMQAENFDLINQKVSVKNWVLKI